MIKRVLTPLSLVGQFALLMLLLGLLGIGSMSVASWMAQSIQGNAHAINKAGSLRMQSYRLLSSIPLNVGNQAYIQQIETDQHSVDLLSAAQREGLEPQFSRLHYYWQNTLKPELQQAQQPAQASASVAVFVSQLDNIVDALEQQTEYHLMLISVIQAGFIGLTLLLLVLTIWFLHRRLLIPWRHLLAQAKAVSEGDFNQRYTLSTSPANKPHNEMDILGQSLNSMSQALAQRVDNLAQRVAEKTADLQQKNEMLDFLYRVSRQLHTSEPLERRLLPVLDELQTLTPLKAIQLRLYENSSEELFNNISVSAELDGEEAYQYDAENAEKHFLGNAPPIGSGHPLSWSLYDDRENYGVLLAQLPPGTVLSDDQRQVITTLQEQLTSSLMLARQAEHQQQLMLMEERSAIARELHDSLAQSLSCLKIQMACLQMQGNELTDESKQLIQQMRDELNTAYRQLRELLTTFRLKLHSPGLRAALQHTVDEFSQRMGLKIDFDYQLPARSVPANQGIHLLHIAREALNNAFKHAQATQISLTLNSSQGEITMKISDNGRGLPQDYIRQNHYGLIIMQDRANSLRGECQISRRSNAGTNVVVRFRPETLTQDPQEQV